MGSVSHPGFIEHTLPMDDSTKRGGQLMSELFIVIYCTPNFVFLYCLSQFQALPPPLKDPGTLEQN